MFGDSYALGLKQKKIIKSEISCFHRRIKANKVSKTPRKMKLEKIIGAYNILMLVRKCIEENMDSMTN